MHHASKAIAENPQLTDAYILRGYGYNGLRKFDLALQDLDRAIEIGHADEAGEDSPRKEVASIMARHLGIPEAMGQTQALRGYALTRMGRHDEAMQALTQTSQSDSRVPGTFLALVHYNQGNYDQARETNCTDIFDMQRDLVSALESQPALDVDIKLDPNNAQALARRAGLHYSFGEYDKFLEDDRWARDLGGRGFDRGEWLTYFRQEQYDLLVEFANDAMTSYDLGNEYDRWAISGMAGALSLRARAYVGLGWYADATQDMEASLVLQRRFLNPVCDVAPY